MSKLIATLSNFVYCISIHIRIYIVFILYYIVSRYLSTCLSKSKCPSRTTQMAYKYCVASICPTKRMEIHLLHILLRRWPFWSFPSCQMTFPFHSDCIRLISVTQDYICMCSYSNIIQIFCFRWIVHFIFVQYKYI